MDVPKDKLEPLRLLAAKQRLGLNLSEDIPPICDQMLKDGVYSPSLAELALNPEPIMSDLEPMLKKAMQELEVSSISSDDALWKVATDIAKRLSSDEAPLSVLEECVAVRRSDYFMGLQGAEDRPKTKWAWEFIWSRYWDYDNVEEVDVDCGIPVEIKDLEERWRYIRPRVQRKVRQWLAETMNADQPHPSHDM